jgi:xanthine dehydrogenase accessory factor
MSEIVSSLDPNTFIASMTMGHSFDLPILNEALKRNVFPYIGVIGSSSKAVVLKNDLLKSGCSELMLQKLYCPIGESFGNNSPSEIAISIASQLIISRDKLSK